MGATAYLYDDWVKDLTSSDVTLTSEDSDYPVTNAMNECVADVARTTAKVSIKIQIDLGSSQTPQAFAILNHNFSGGTFDINSYTAADFSTGKTTVESAKAVTTLDVYHRESSAPASRQYWELDLSSVTSAASYFQFGRVMVYSDFTSLSDAEDWDRGRAYGFRSILNKTAFGVVWAHKLEEKREEFGLKWTFDDPTNMPGELRTLYDSIHGQAHPFLYVPDLANTDCHYVRCTADKLTWREYVDGTTKYMVAEIKLPMLEEPRGRP